jgi:hypothetical protein
LLGESEDGLGEDKDGRLFTFGKWNGMLFGMVAVEL